MSRFGSATAAAGQLGLVELPRLRERTISMNTMTLTVGGDLEDLLLDEGLAAADIDQRVAAAQALTSYGEALLALVEKSEEEDLRKAADQLTNSFKSVSEQPLGDAQLEAIGQVVRSVGGWFVEWKRKGAVKTLVIDTQPAVDHVCDLMIQDFDVNQLHVLGSVKNTQQRLLSAADAALASAGNGRADAAEARRLAEEARAEIALVGGRALQALRTLKQANATLVEVIQDDSLSFSDIKKLGGEMQQVGNALKTLAIQ